MQVVHGVIFIQPGLEGALPYANLTMAVCGSVRMPTLQAGQVMI